MANTPGSEPPLGQANNDRGSLESLIEYLLAAKRSLSAIDDVWRANELVTNSRSVLEESIATSAQTIFLRKGISGQMKILRQVRSWIGEVADLGTSQFNTLLQELDEIDSRLHEVFEVLKSTSIESQFQGADEPIKTLHDFVDENGFEALKENLRTMIDSVQSLFDSSISAFEDDAKLVEDSLQLNMSVQAIHSPIPALLEVMEGHASDMAELLSSLVDHYDHCTTALKHTEGGGDAAQSLTTNLPAGVDLTKSDQSASPEPITEEERQILLDIIEKDASEVEDARQEIKEHLADMEVQFEHVTAFASDISSFNVSTLAAVEQLELVGTRLVQYVQSAQTYLLSWEDDRSRIEDAMNDMLLMRDFYDNFLGAYDDLILEVARRRKMQNKMESVVKDALAKINALYKEDFSERENFRQDSGQHLPSDIWSGLLDPPAKYDFLQIDSEKSQVPHLSKDVVDRARQRRGR